MAVDVSIKFRDGSTNRTIEIPNTCPHCGETMTPQIFGGFSTYSQNDSFSNFGVLAICSASECSKYFGLRYICDYDAAKRKYITSLQKDSYRPPIKVELPENIEKVSATFVEIYSQATKAEAEGLDQIAGVGYRKSLEFLIKDYAIRNHPEDEDKIKKIFLGPVISEYLSDFPKLQSLAKAAN